MEIHKNLIWTDFEFKRAFSKVIKQKDYYGTSKSIISSEFRDGENYVRLILDIADENALQYISEQRLKEYLAKNKSATSEIFLKAEIQYINKSILNCKVMSQLHEISTTEVEKKLKIYLNHLKGAFLFLHNKSTSLKIDIIEEYQTEKTDSRKVEEERMRNHILTYLNPIKADLGITAKDFDELVEILEYFLLDGKVKILDKSIEIRDRGNKKLMKTFGSIYRAQKNSKIPYEYAYLLRMNISHFKKYKLLEEGYERSTFYKYFF